MINRNYKDRVFIKLFGSEEYKDNLLELYNALNETNYTDINELTISTIDNVIYMGYKNDISFLISNELTLFEHMSTYNPNMSLRGFIYLAKQYEKYLAENDINIHTSKRIKIPNPRYYIFYNGLEDIDDEITLRLSDSFIKSDSSSDIECLAHLLNINYGKNKKLLEHCKTLNEYAILINTIRKKVEQEEDRTVAVVKAVDECIEQGVLKKFLHTHKAEVVGMLLTEFDEERYLKDLKTDSFEEGEERGKQIAIEVIKSLNKGMSIEKVAKQLDVPIEDISEIAKAMNL